MAKKAATSKTKSAKPAAAAPKPIKDSFTKSELARHLADQAGVEPKAAKAVLAALEATMLGSCLLYTSRCV